MSSRYVFMSYSRRDETVMRRIVGYLREQGIKIWVDNEKLIPGTPIWEAEIESAIKGASAVIVVLSPDSKESEWVRREITLADQYHTRVFPVLVRGDEESSITLRLITRQYVDLTKNEQAGLASLCSALHGYLSELKAQEQTARESAERVAGERAKHEAAEKAAREKAERESAEMVIHEETKKAFTKNSKSESTWKTLCNFLASWKGRVLSGGLAGLLLAFLVADEILYPGVQTSSAMPLFGIYIGVCGIAGLVTYPHLISMALLVIGFVAGDLLPSEPSNFGAIIIGIPAGALLSRILHWLKILK